MNQPALITVCIVHYRKLKQLKRTVRDLLVNTVSPIRIKILNQGYVNPEITDYFDGIKNLDNVNVTMNDTNTGCSPGRNVLTKNIETPFIMILDDDMYVNERWDVPVMRHFEQHPDIGAIGFSIYRINGEFWFTGGQSIEIKNGRVKNTRVNLDPKTTDAQFLDVDDVCAGAMIYRKSIESLIPWDLEYFIGFEDLEKGIYLKRNNIRCAVSVQSRFIHDKVSESKDFKEYNEARRDYHAFRRSYLHFMKKNNLQWDLPHHLFSKYVCLLPNSWIRHFVYFWLKYIK